MIHLVTGAAGFIGSNLVEALLRRGEQVIGVDNFISGKRENIRPFLERIRFVEGDVRDPALCAELCRGVDFVLHQAALSSVPHSVADPLTVNDHNVNGTLHMLLAARDAGVKRLVYAASTSVYGDATALPTDESIPPNPLSPYAVSKYVGELYCKVFHELYGLSTIGLRYFNVFGPRQDPHGPYAPVISKFAHAILRGERPVIFGDGEQTRDFCYVDNVVQANLKACVAPASASGRSYNIGSGERISIRALAGRLLERLGSDLEPEYQPARPGDVRDSLASIHLARAALGYEPEVDCGSGLERYVRWLQAQSQAST
jgi:nucleoside-diphosphate-sugar epimerase